MVQGRPIRIDPDAFSASTPLSLQQHWLGKVVHDREPPPVDPPKPGGSERRDPLDTNGEYRTAFQKQKDDGKWEDAGSGKTLYIPSDPKKGGQRLVIPYWFMNAEDFVRLFQASKGCATGSPGSSAPSPQ
ncbi:MAG: DUF87 domain-containing protein [Polyangiaceae bacterium]